MDLDISLLTPIKVLYKGKARSLKVPGERGYFEILPYHKSILSRLLFGDVEIDMQVFPIKRGLIRLNDNKVTIIVEERSEP